MENYNLIERRVLEQDLEMGKLFRSVEGLRQGFVFLQNGIKNSFDAISNNQNLALRVLSTQIQQIDLLDLEFYEIHQKDQNLEISHLINISDRHAIKNALCQNYQLRCLPPEDPVASPQHQFLGENFNGDDILTLCQICSQEFLMHPIRRGEVPSANVLRDGIVGAANSGGASNATGERALNEEFLMRRIESLQEKLTQLETSIMRDGRGMGEEGRERRKEEERERRERERMERDAASEVERHEMLTRMQQLESEQNANKKKIHQILLENAELHQKNKILEQQLSRCENQIQKFEFHQNKIIADLSSKKGAELKENKGDGRERDTSPLRSPVSPSFSPLPFSPETDSERALLEKMNYLYKYISQQEMRTNDFFFSYLEEMEKLMREVSWIKTRMGGGEGRWETSKKNLTDKAREKNLEKSVSRLENLMIKERMDHQNLMSQVLILTAKAANSADGKSNQKLEFLMGIDFLRQIQLGLETVILTANSERDRLSSLVETFAPFQTETERRIGELEGTIKNSVLPVLSSLQGSHEILTQGVQYVAQYLMELHSSQRELESRFYLSLGDGEHYARGEETDSSHQKISLWMDKIKVIKSKKHQKTKQHEILYGDGSNNPPSPSEKNLTLETAYNLIHSASNFVASLEKGERSPQ